MDADRATEKAADADDAKKKIAAALMAVKMKAGNGQNVGFDPMGQMPLTKKGSILGTRG